MASGASHPLVSGSRLELAGAVRIMVVVDRIEMSGTSTGGEAPKTEAKLFPRTERMPLAAALTDWHRQGLSPSAVPTVAQLAGDLKIGRGRVYEWADELAGLPAVAAYLELAWWAEREGGRPQGWLVDLSEALVMAFPEVFGSLSRRKSS